MRRLAGFGLGLLLLALPATASADATPAQIVLLYTPNVSTTNTPAASGIAELVLQEGEVRISVADLPRLNDNGQYVAWVIDTDANAFMRLGAFNTAASTGAAHFEQVLPDDGAPTSHHWSLVLLTIENTPTPDHPGPAHSIAGTFPPAGGDSLPQLLPNTGGAPDGDSPFVLGAQSSVNGASWADRLPIPGLAALVLAVTGVAGYALGRRAQTH